MKIQCKKSLATCDLW